VFSKRQPLEIRSPELPGVKSLQKKKKEGKKQGTIFFYHLSDFDVKL
jgi:hypothetical protein